MRLEYQNPLNHGNLSFGHGLRGKAAPLTPTTGKTFRLPVDGYGLRAGPVGVCSSK